MRTTQRDRRTVWYALYNGIVDMVDGDGNYTGEQAVSYATPVQAKMNVSGGRGQSEIELFGIDNPFTRTLVTEDLTTPFDSDTVFWFEANPLEEEHNYRCTGISRTINQVVIAIAEIDRTRTPIVSA